MMIEYPSEGFSTRIGTDTNSYPPQVDSTGCLLDEIYSLKLENDRLAQVVADLKLAINRFEIEHDSIR